MQLRNFFRKLVHVPPMEDAQVSEIGEKRTTVLGYVLLVLMVIIGVWQGETFLGKVSEMINAPTAPSYCASTFRDYADRGVATDVFTTRSGEFSYYGDTRDCVSSVYETRHGVDALEGDVHVLLSERDAIDAEKSTNDAQLADEKAQLDAAKRDYDLSLEEQQVSVKLPVMSPTSSSVAIPALSDTIAQLIAKGTALEAERRDVNTRLDATIDARRADLDAVFTEYERDVALADIFRRLLTLLFVGPALWFALRRYFIAQGKHSSSGIIWAAVTTIFAILFAQSIGGLIYDVIPHEVIDVLLRLFAQFRFAAVLAQYCLLVLVPALFGWIVYLIQKRVYGKRAVYLRALKSSKCPNCAMQLRDAMRFCPSCGFEVLIRCNACGGDRHKGLPYCDHCGAKDETKGK